MALSRLLDVIYSMVSSPRTMFDNLLIIDHDDDDDDDNDEDYY